MSPIRRMLSEPLLHFVVVAIVVVVAARAYERRHDEFRIVMTDDRVTQLAASYQQQFGVEAGPELRGRLVQSDFEDEVLYREALALHLDKDDEIIRRRLIQKMKFLTQDQHAPAEPTRAQLQAFFDAHRDQYLSKPSATFTHVFFASDTNDDQSGRTRALSELARLKHSNVPRAPGAGDGFPDRYDFSSYEPDQVARLFGRSEFLQAVFSAPIGEWVGPVRSAYGWHLLRVAARQASAIPSFNAVQDKVRRDFLESAQDAANRAALDRMRRQFTLVRVDHQVGQ
jgi:hypothetical protein